MKMFTKDGKLKKMFRHSTAVVCIWIITIAMLLAASIVDSDFRSIRNLQNLLVTSLPLLLCACGQTLIIITGGIDLTVGSILSFGTVTIAALATEHSGGWVPALIAVLAGGLFFGFLNGVIITKGRQQPIIVTIATSEIIAGCALLIQPKAGKLIANINFCTVLSGGRYKAVPIILASSAVAFIWYLLRMTVFGRSLYAVGGNEISAVSSGIRSDNIKIIAYMLSGLFAAMAGVFQGTIMYSGDPNSGAMFPMRSITAAVIGGTMLSGGVGGIIGTLAGVIILAVINNILNLTGVSTFYQYVIQGVILLLALTISALRTRHAKR